MAQYMMFLLVYTIHQLICMFLYDNGDTDGPGHSIIVVVIIVIVIVAFIIVIVMSGFARVAGVRIMGCVCGY
jgi:hypothetical protein